MRETAAHAWILVVALVVAGCGGGSNERQDENEPEGEFPVEVVDVKWPKEQKLAKSSTLELTVRNVGDEEIPNINATVNGFYYRQEETAGLADRSRPQFVVDRIPLREGPPERDVERLDPLERSSAYVNTYPLGKLAENEEVTFVWEVTAVRGGPYCIAYEIAAGLDGKARAVLESERPEATCDDARPDTGRPTEKPTGVFSGIVSDKPPQARIAADGETVIQE